MRLKKCFITNFRGIKNKIEVCFDDYIVIVGKNDAGKSTILKALDLFLNESEANRDMLNISAENHLVEIECLFDAQHKEIIIDESVTTTFEQEELINEDGLLHIKKVYNTSASRITPEVSIRRKKYENSDFILLPEDGLRKLCEKFSIPTAKANGDIYNNVEKRQKLRNHLNSNEENYTYIFEKVVTTGSSRSKAICDEIKKHLPHFQYYKADSSLSESDTSIQNYFKKISEDKINAFGIEEIENHITASIGAILEKISTKINDVLPSEERVQPEIKFDWSKVVQTSFRSPNQESSVPLRFRGDGFRRITMMAYFEYLAEEKKSEHQNIIFGFEEPETFLHPSAQETLFEKFKAISENSYQVFLTTHSPTIVANACKSNIIHVKKEGGIYNLFQNLTSFDEIISDLGININNQLLDEFDKTKVLLLVEGPDDVKALSFISELYKENNEISLNLKELGVLLIPIGGCDSIKHWATLNLLKDLNKPHFIILDSDKKSELDVSSNLTKLLALDFLPNQDFYIWKKRCLENYINISCLQRRIEGLEIEYNDWTDVKKLCKEHTHQIRLGGSKVADYHFCHQTYAEIKESFCKHSRDEFLEIYNLVKTKLPSATNVIA